MEKRDDTFIFFFFFFVDHMRGYTSNIHYKVSWEFQYDAHSGGKPQNQGLVSIVYAVSYIWPVCIAVILLTNGTSI